ncbi:hypothetical protein [Clostridium thailandense]|uniref:Uncharacterized protein n=1 Tax=Clostridium thailandense TaxID=2794346 RepID=A0A949TKY6_9CLOT|nr:hypothetical protein [Clostridium thailandense]MBV7274779.1 hypothetical protein [Clostridium thailandense]MCH5137240.1 hypothetical protein [Clostridiaceae bacterium UIB06]
MAGKNDLIEKVEVDKVEWTGIDGFLVLMFFIVGAIIWISIIKKIDVVVGLIIPISLAIIVTVIFVAYLMEIFKFYKNKSK